MLDINRQSVGSFPINIGFRRDPKKGPAGGPWPHLFEAKLQTVTVRRRNGRDYLLIIFHLISENDSSVTCQKKLFAELTIKPPQAGKLEEMGIAYDGLLDLSKKLAELEKDRIYHGAIASAPDRLDVIRRGFLDLRNHTVTIMGSRSLKSLVH